MSATILEIPLNVSLDVRMQSQVTAITTIGVRSLKGACAINSVEEGGFRAARPPLALLRPYGSPSGVTAGGMYAAGPTSYSFVESGKWYIANAGNPALVGTVLNTTAYAIAMATITGNAMLQPSTTPSSTAYYYNGAFAAITDTNFVSLNRVGSVAYLDGTYYVMTSDGSVYGSNFNDPTTWSALNRVNAWQDSSNGVAILKHRGYIVALKESSMQPFYDAGNPVGSPLLPLLQAIQPMGCALASSLQEIKGDHFWVGQAQDNTLCIVQMSNLVISPVSPPSVNRWLEARFNQGLGGGGNAGRGLQFSAWGHSFYAITFGDSQPLLVYDIGMKEWGFWDSGLNDLSQLVNGCLLSSFIAGNTSTAPAYVYQGLSGYYRLVDAPYTQGVSGNPAVTVAQSWADSNATLTKAVPWQVTTPVIDGGLMVEKTAMKLEIFSDNFNNGALEVSWSDDDYGSWSGFVPMTITSPRAFMIDLGTFYRRAFRFRHIGNTPLRISRAALTVLVGS